MKEERSCWAEICPFDGWEWDILFVSNYAIASERSLRETKDLSLQNVRVHCWKRKCISAAGWWHFPSMVRIYDIRWKVTTITGEWRQIIWVPDTTGGLWYNNSSCLISYVKYDVMHVLMLQKMRKRSEMSFWLSKGSCSTQNRTKNGKKNLFCFYISSSGREMFLRAEKVYLKIKISSPKTHRPCEIHLKLD